MIGFFFGVFNIIFEIIIRILMVGLGMIVFFIFYYVLKCYFFDLGILGLIFWMFYLILW